MKKITVLLLALLCLTSSYADDKLTGTYIGSEWSWDYQTNAPSKTANTFRAAFDGNPDTFFAAYDRSFGWAGIDLGTPHVITRVGWIPRNSGNGGERVLLGIFEGANSPDFMDAVLLYLIDEAGTARVAESHEVEVSRGFRYVRYVGPHDARCNIAEVEFYGHEGEGDDSKFYQITDLPTVSIHVTNNDDPQDKGTDFESNITIVYDKGTLIQEYPILTRVRGNYSASWQNKPYRIKFNDDKKHHMLKDSEKDESPAKAKKWTLISSYGDKTLMRNPVAYEVSKRIGMPFTPWCKPVDLILNGEYRGTYQLTDHVDVKEDRVNLVEMTPEDNEGEALTGGYMIEMNGYAGQDPVNFTSYKGNPVTVHNPEPEAITPQQFGYIRNHFNEMERRVFSSDYTDREKGYRSMLDLDSFLKYFLSNEFSSNTDMLWQVYMFKERGDDHIFTGPVWDNDLSLENDGGYFPGNQQSDWTYKIRGAGTWRELVTRVLSDGNAMARLQTIWKSLRDNEVFTAENIAQYVDSTRTRMAASARLNHIRWPYLLQKVHCNPTVWGSWDAEVDNVRDFVYGRVAWMDNMLNYNQLKTKNGAYLIESPYDLCVFADKVNGGETTAKAIVTCDIDMQDYTEMFRPVGSIANPFCGTIDGGGHTISHLVVEGMDNVGFVAVAGDNCVIRALTLDDDCRFLGNNNVGGFVGTVVANGNVVIQQSANEACVTAINSQAGGFVGGYNNSTASVSISDSYNTGAVEAPSHAASFVGYAGNGLSVSNSYNVYSASVLFADGENAVFYNCYDVNVGESVATVTVEAVRSGELCYNLNAGAGASLWRQNIDNGRARDNHPVLSQSHGLVFNIDGRYTNINPNVQGYRYYRLDITEIAGGACMQLAEFDLLDAMSEEYADLYVYSGTDSGISQENWMNIADNDLGTKYCNPRFYEPVHFYFDCGEAFDVYGYRMYTANDTQYIPERNPISWALYGSDSYSEDASDACWQLIDERQGDTTLGATSYTPYDFSISRAVESITINSQSELMNPGTTIQLTATVTPTTMSNVPVVWKSSDESVATVSGEGVVMAHTIGKTVISASPEGYDFLSAECNITVTDDVIGYQYYMLEIDELVAPGVFQMSEVGLLDVSMEHMPHVECYAGPEQNYNNEGWRNLTDDDVQTKFCGPCVEGEILYFLFDATGMIMPRGYYMTTANDTNRYPGRNPKTWRLWGSNSFTTDTDDSRWILLDERMEDNTVGASRYTQYDFLIDWVAVGIEDVTHTAASGRVYNVAGQRISSPQRGVNIKDGRKVVR